MAGGMRKRFRNKTDKLQVVYDETGAKREIVPEGTVILDAKLGLRYSRVLEEVPAKKPEK